jgi:hypothetical protein
MTNEILAERYGTKRPTSQLKKLILGSSALAAAVATTAWFAIANHSVISFTDVGFSVVSEYQVIVDFELRMPIGTVGYCNLQALSNSFGVVGHKQFELGPFESETLRFSEAINTTELAVTGLVDECWVR